MSSPYRPPTSASRIEPHKSNTSGLNVTGLMEDEVMHSGMVAPFNSSLIGRSRVSDVAAQLLSVEKDVGDLRDELAERASENDALKAALQRERESVLRIQAKHQQEVDTLRTEYQSRNSQLTEQLAVIKGISESAQAEGNRAKQEAVTRKAQMLALMDKERNEKSQIMSDYRQQTEALIAEQGREITGLRNVIAAARTQEEKLFASSRIQEDRRSELEEQLLRSESALSDERVTNEKRLKELEHRLQAQTDALRRQMQAEDHEHRSSFSKLHAAKEAAEDEIRSLTEKLKAVEASNAEDREKMRSAYDSDVSALQEELRSVTAAKELMEEDLRADIAKLSRGDEELIASLRRDIDAARREKQSVYEEQRSQREGLVQEHQHRISQMQLLLDSAKNDVTEERSLRKDAETARQTATMKADSLHAQVTRLSSELENLRVDSRTRERTTEHDFLNTLDDLRSQCRSAEAENAKLKQLSKRLEYDLQRLADDAQSKAAMYETTHREAQHRIETLTQSCEMGALQLEESIKQQNKLVDQHAAQKVVADAEIHRLQRTLAEKESHLNAVTVQLKDERAALESAMGENQSQRALVGQLNLNLENEQSKMTDALTAIAERDDALEVLREQIDANEKNLFEATRQADKTRSELLERTKRFDVTTKEMRVTHRAEIAALEEQLRATRSSEQQLRDAISAHDDVVMSLRDEVTRWQRECIAKEELSVQTIQALRKEADEELARLEILLNAQRDDVARAQGSRAAAMRDVAEGARESDRRAAIMQESLDLERASKLRLHEELRAKEQLIAEVQGTVRLLASRMASKEEEVRRLEAELQDITGKLHDAHSLVGKKDALAGQLAAKLRVYESRGIL